jgi:hypothetical protein
MNVRISHIIGSGNFEPRLIIDIPEVTLVRDLTLQSTRDAAMILSDKYKMNYLDSVYAIKAAIRDVQDSYTIPADTLEWANEE